MQNQNKGFGCFRKIALLLFIISSVLYGGVTIHVQNPWKSDPAVTTIKIVGNVPDFGYTTDNSSAKPLNDDGDGWFTYTFKTTPKSSKGEIKIVKPVGESWKWTSISIGSLSTLFAGATNKQTEVWITFDAAGKMKTTLDPMAAGATAIYLYNPFPETSPSMIIDGKITQMQLTDTYKGWYVGYYMGKRENLKISFTDYFKSQWFNSDGGKKSDNSAAPIDLIPFKDSGPVLFIWPQPRPTGKPKVSNTFPGFFGEPTTRTISAIVRDWKSGAFGGEFEGNFDNEVAIKGMVKNELTNKGKIQKGTKDYSSANLTKWFEDSNISNGTNKTCIKIDLKKSNDGGWSFNSDEYGGFYPIDDFNPWGDPKKPDDKGVDRNFGFTMELRTEFEYYAGRNQTFYFSGDDDVWVFVNGKLAIDLGGPHQALADSFNLDLRKNEFGLVDGSVNRLDMFFCERQSNSSNFRMRTTLNIDNSNSLLLDTIKDGNKDHFIVKEVKVGNFGNECGINIYDPEEADTVLAHVKFKLFGGKLASEGKVLESNKVNYGGIDIKGDTEIIIDTSVMNGLDLGTYQIIGEDANSYTTSPITFTLRGKATFKVDTALVNLSSVPEEIHYKTNTLDVNLSTDSDCNVFYSLAGNSSGTPSGSFSEKGKVVISGENVTMKVHAEGSTNTFKTKSDEKEYRFIRDMPAAEIIALPSNAPNRYTFNTATLDVTLAVVVKGDTLQPSEKVKIWYELKDGKATDKKKEYKAGDKIRIDSDDILNAYGEFTFTNPASGTWSYDQDFDDATLQATPGNSSPNSPYEYSKGSLQVNLKTSKGGTIHYSIFSQGGRANVFTSSISEQGNVTIYGNDTIWAYADGATLDRIDGVWSYKSNLPATDLNARANSETVSTVDSYLFGHTLDVELVSDAVDTINFTINKSDVSKSDSLYSDSKKIKILNSDPDTIQLKALAYDKDHQETRKNWRFVRDTLPSVKFSETTKKFSGTISLNLSLDAGRDNGWKDVEIWYTTDGTDPDKVRGNGKSLGRSGTIQIDTTKEVRARGFASNRIESPIVKEYYTLVAGAKEAWYLDQNGDGQIDFAHIELNMAVNKKPSEIVLVSPFDKNEKVTLSGDVIEFKDGKHLRMKIDPQFKFPNSTTFSSGVYGTMKGDEFADNSEISLRDSVAPVIISAIYSPGKIKQTLPNVVRYNDTLIVNFSENINVANKSEPFKFRSGSNEYVLSYNDNDTKIDGSKATFIVKQVSGGTTPISGDEIHINPSAEVSDNQSVNQTNGNNRWVRLEVKEIPYQLVVNAISPVNPKEFKIPSDLASREYKGENALIILADFLVPIKNTDAIKGSIKIFDMLGNVVVQKDGLGRDEHVTTELHSSGKSTRVIFYWDGKNQSGRNVGVGAYLAVVSIADQNGQTTVNRLSIGVKK